MHSFCMVLIYRGLGWAELGCDKHTRAEIDEHDTSDEMLCERECDLELL